MKLNKENYNVLLAQNCLSQSEVAKLSRVGKGTIARLLLGEDARPQTIGKIAKALKTEVLKLIEVEGSGNN